MNSYELKFQMSEVVESMNYDAERLDKIIQQLDTLTTVPGPLVRALESQRRDLETTIALIERIKDKVENDE